MKIRIFLSLALLAMSLVSCVKDDTTLGTGAISVISIDSTSIQENYYISKNETLVIQPAVQQTNAQKPLQWIWEIEQQQVASGPVFEYVANELGTFRCRLIAENEDGKSFFYFTINVNTPYEEGLTMISKDKNGKAKLSFLLFNPQGQPEGSFTTEDCFLTNNPDEVLVSNPSDIVHSGSTLLLSCQGNAAAGEPAAIYYLNDKTMLVENKISAPEYADFLPTRMVIPSRGFVGVSYPILCENGSVYEFSSSEGALIPSRKMPYRYAQNALVYDDGSGRNYSLIFWDKEIKDLCSLLTGWGPYYCTRDYEKNDRSTLIEASKTNPQVNYFFGQEFVKMELIRMTPAQALTQNSQILVLSQSPAVCSKVILNSGFWVYNFEEEKNYLDDNGGFKTAGVGALPINETTPTIANATTKSMFFAEGNKVRRWFFTSSQFVNNADTFLEVGTPTSVITSFEISADHKVTYVAFYDPAQDGNNGSVWAFDTDKGTVLHKWDNISYQPVKLIYKKK